MSNPDRNQHYLPTDILPSAFYFSENPMKHVGKKKLAIFLDYDGTLTPIVDDPAKALLKEKMRMVVEEISTLCILGIISGRDRADVEEKVNIPSLIFAGSHGYDISGPGLAFYHEKGLECLPALDNAEMELRAKFQSEKEVQIERKKFAIAVHYRFVPEENIDAVLKTVSEVLGKHSCLKAGPGKMILELRPDYDWHKGKALWWLIGQIADPQDVYPVYIGDDMTDEDAFKAIQGKGMGILVGQHGGLSAAGYSLKDTEEVYLFLRQLADSLNSES